MVQHYEKLFFFCSLFLVVYKMIYLQSSLMASEKTHYSYRLKSANGFFEHEKEAR